MRFAVVEDPRPAGEAASGEVSTAGQRPLPRPRRRLSLVIPERGGRMTLRRLSGGAGLRGGARARCFPPWPRPTRSTPPRTACCPQSVAINSIWVVVAALLVIFMQAGFAFLEIGFSRGKNVGTVVAKILTNFSIAALLYWAVGFAFAFGNGDIIGDAGLLPARLRRSAGGVRRSWASPTRRSSRSGCSSSRSAPSRWRSSGARRSSASSSASTSSTRSCSPASSTRSARTGSSAAAGCRPTSACRTSPARRRST